MFKYHETKQLCLKTEKRRIQKRTLTIHRDRIKNKDIWTVYTVVGEQKPYFMRVKLRCQTTRKYTTP